MTGETGRGRVINCTNRTPGDVREVAGFAAVRPLLGPVSCRIVFYRRSFAVYVCVLLHDSMLFLLYTLIRRP